MKLLTCSFLALSASFCISPFAHADQVINDDLIVTSSECIGFDCVNGENFGFDTLRLKENNIRIHFNDTSISASFPTNDWRIVANDSGNGGENYLGIEDSNTGRFPFRVQAGAPADALVVEADGDIGVKTRNPVVDIHIVEGNTPTVRLEQDGSDGFTPQTWDMAGNEANFFIRDVTNGSQLPLRIEPGADTNSLYVNSNGHIGIGTNSPDTQVHLVETANTNTVFRVENKNATGSNAEVSLVNSIREWKFRNNTVGNFVINAPGDTGFELELREDGTLILEGGLITGTPSGTCNPGPCDATFQPDKFTVPSIEDHAEYMWENSYLWGVGPTREGIPMNLTKKTGGILHELEVAHIYIEQLHHRLKDMENRLEAFEQK
ncbi:hypothetical protein GCM10008090_07020 [Arenicella chitinivorans]|uniref:Uncharacterized protein n=1 Tax=Arenicella chitinivorans TaxID=1329800 RepID=A0A918VH14_9GAMM|nr:hypothetical protein [Arenicella chitinivorans]GHA00670.1 hypothetical protein GCM10008090_07020 [Arenicella chitinivorans]